MPDEEDPQGTKIGPDDLRSCKWRDALDAAAREDYWSMSQALSTAASKAVEGGQAAAGRALRLLADACSMMLQPASLNEPFQPMFVMGGRRSALPQDLSSSDIEVLATVVDELDDVLLKARVADLVWLVRKPREVRFALMAIDAYCAVPFSTTEAWIRGGRECWDRAARLARSVGEPGHDRWVEIESALLAAFEQAHIDDGYMIAWIAELMDKVGMAHSRSAAIAEKLETVARGSDTAGVLLRSADYFEAANKWYEKSKNRSKAAEMCALLAEVWAKQAEHRATVGPGPSHMVAAGFLENAIHAYRRVPRRERTKYRVDERIVELRTRMSAHGEHALDEMAVVRSPSIDISEMVRESRQAVTKLPLEAALVAFADIARGVSVQRVREEAVELLKKHPLQAMTSMTVMVDGGRVIARRPGFDTGDDSASGSGGAVWAEMVRDFDLRIGLVVKAHIWPALEQICLEHWIKEWDLVNICAHSQLVPHGRERLVGKGLFAGFGQDFVTAIHVLVPQVEHMVRWQLNARGVPTTTIDQDGIENEIGLSALLDIPQVEGVFGKDLTFELKALFADPHGANLRNAVAHGLLDSDQLETVYGVYAWWLCFRLVFKTARAALPTPNPDTGEQAPPGNDAA
jgi:hypothetical protein